MTKANVSYGRLREYLDRLEAAGFVHQLEEDGATLFRTSEAGRRFVSHYADLVDPLIAKGLLEEEVVVPRRYRRASS